MCRRTAPVACHHLALPTLDPVAVRVEEQLRRCRTVEDDGVYPTLAGRLNHLFGVDVGRKGREPTYREVATAIADRGGPTVSPSYIWQLRTGLKDNPTLKHLEALAGYFEVEPAYFFDSATAERVEADRALSIAMADPTVRELTLAAAELSPESLRMVRSVIERTRALERSAVRQPGAKGARNAASTD